MHYQTDITDTYTHYILHGPGWGNCVVFNSHSLTLNSHGLSPSRCMQMVTEEFYAWGGGGVCDHAME